MTLLPDRDKDDTVTFNTGAADGTLSLMATASGASDDGYYKRHGHASTWAACDRLEELQRRQPGSWALLTTGGGEATAVQCGDLLVAHAMPAIRRWEGIAPLRWSTIPRVPRRDPRLPRG